MNARQLAREFIRDDTAVSRLAVEDFLREWDIVDDDTRDEVFLIALDLKEGW